MMDIKHFDNLIWSRYSQDRNFNKIRAQLLRIRSVLIDKYPELKSLPVQRQYDICVTVGIIANQTATQAIAEVEVITKRNVPDLPYSINYGYVEPAGIEIDHNNTQKP